MKNIIFRPFIWIVSLFLVIVVHLIFAWDDWRIRRRVNGACK